MLKNRSVPPCAVIPVLTYPDVEAAAGWLCAAFGFRVRLRIGDHRIQMWAGDGCFVIAEGEASPSSTCSVMVRVPDAESHCRHAHQHAAEITRPPADFPYGERQYNVLDVAGYRWTFTQSLADVAPEDWGGVSVEL